MSAALQLQASWEAPTPQAVWNQVRRKREQIEEAPPAPSPSPAPDATLAFYRKHTESMLMRYLYASMQVGRTPELLRNSVGRGWVSSRPVRTFEDAVIFVLDMETCLRKLTLLDRKVLTCVVLQDYTQVEAADILGMGVRTVSYKLPLALDRLTRILLDAGLLVLPH
jgi:DNA-directed RNA polymerase specialized sigma24 family protein